MSVRDGEPIPAAVSEAVRSLPASQRELERLRQMRDALRALPEIAPPADGWLRVLAAEHERRIAPHRWLKALTSVGAIAAAAAVVAVLIATAPPENAGTVDSAPPVAASRSASRVAPIAQEPDRPPEYVALIEESARLEQLLATLPSPRPRMSVAVASTIVGIEDRIAFIDEQLTFGNARGVQWPQREALWSERVDLMSALVQVRLAQSR